MRRAGWSLLLIWISGAACNRLPESFPPPPQYPSLDVASPQGVGHFLSMDDPRADLYLVQDFQDHGPGTWRWAYAHPVLRFFLPDAAGLKFTMDFTIPSQTFRDTGPITLTVRVNGTVLDRHQCEQAGEQHYMHDVPAGLVRANAMNLVAIDPEPVWFSKTDGARFGFILSRAGFTD